MLSSVLFARDKFCPQVMIPDLAQLFIVGFYNEDYYHQRLDWTQKEQFGIDFSSVQEDICSEISIDSCLGVKRDKSHCSALNNPNIVTTCCQVFNGDLFEIVENGEHLVDETEFKLILKYDDKRKIHGIIVYFETHFEQSENGRLTLTNSPYALPTHWQQSICLFKEPVGSSDGEAVKGTIQVKAYSGSKKRRQGIQILLKIKGRKNDDSQFQYILPWNILLLWI